MATQEADEKKAVVVRGLPVVIASWNGFGAKYFSAEELEAAVKQGLALEATPVCPWGRGCVGLHSLKS